MKSGKKLFLKKRNKINFSNVINKKGKEDSKNESNISTYPSNNYSYSVGNINNKKQFLDYTFQEKKSIISNQKNNDNIINKMNITNYYYELKKTFILNLDIILYYYNNKKTEENEKIDKENKEILKLLKIIKEKEIKRNAIKLTIKQKYNCLISKNENLYFYYKKYQRQINIYNIKIDKKLSEINSLNSYITFLAKNFSFVDIYIKKLRFITEGKKGLKHNKNKLTKYIEKNNRNMIKIRNYNKNIQKLKIEISEIKKDNKLSKRQIRLIKAKNPNIDLIRIVEFYIRIIRTISLRNQFLKNSMNSLGKTLELLDLNQIKDFNEYKRTRQKSSYELEFSDLENNYYEENKNDDSDKKEELILNNLKYFMDFSKILNI